MAGDPKSLNTKLFIFFTLNTVLLNLLILFLFEIPWYHSIFYYIFDRFLGNKQEWDSWDPMMKAFDYIRFENRGSVYMEIMFRRHTEFQYPPSSLLVLVPLTPLCMEDLMSGPECYIVRTALRYVSWIFVALMPLFVVLLFEETVKRTASEENKQAFMKGRVARYVLLCLFTLSFYPMMRGFHLGQIQPWINTTLAAMFWLWMRDKKGISGVLAALISLVKPQYGLFLAWALLRRQWSFAVPFAVCAVAGVVVSGVAFGFGHYLHYLGILSFLTVHGESFLANQSVNGLLHRWFQNGDISTRHWFPAFHPHVYIGTVVSSLIFMLAAFGFLYWHRNTKKVPVQDLMIIGLTATMASPIAWEHHYGILLPIYSFLLARFFVLESTGVRSVIYLMVSYVLASNYFFPLHQFSYVPVWNVLLCYLFAGAFMVLISLYADRRAYSLDQRIALGQGIRTPAPSLNSV